MPKLIGNPLYHWNQLELARYFNVFDLLGPSSAEKIYSQCNELLGEEGLSSRKLIKQSNVKVICTTDDPCDTLEHHEKINTDIIPIIESEKGLKNLKEICEFKERIKVISFGSHDLAKSINLKVSDDEKEILSYRKLIVSHSKNPIDTSYLNFKDLIGFEKSCNLAKSIGFGGKACIHPGQIEISNKIFS